MTKYIDFDNKENYGVQICTSSTRPTAYEGRHIYETDTNKTLVCTNVVGPVWEEISGGGVGDFLADGTVPMTGNLDMDNNTIEDIGGLLPHSDGGENIGSSSLLWNLVYSERVLGNSTTSLVCDFRGDAKHKIWFNGITLNDLEYVTFAEHRFMVGDTPAEILKIDSDELAMVAGKKVTLNGVGGGTYIKDDASGNMELHVATGKSVKIVVG